MARVTLELARILLDSGCGASRSHEPYRHHGSYSIRSREAIFRERLTERVFPQSALLLSVECFSGPSLASREKRRSLFEVEDYARILAAILLNLFCCLVIER